MHAHIAVLLLAGYFEAFSTSLILVIFRASKDSPTISSDPLPGLPWLEDHLNTSRMKTSSQVFPTIKRILDDPSSL